MNALLTDKQLTTEDQIIERMTSIKRKREMLCEDRSGNRTTHINSFNKRQQSIAKLTERLDSFSARLKALRKGTING